MFMFACHRPCARLVFLTIEFGRSESLARAQVHFFLQNQLALDEQSGGAAARIVDIHARSRVHDASDNETNFRRRVKLSRALAAAFGELADQVFVAAPDDVWLHVGEAERLGTNRLDEITQPVIIYIALAVRRSIEVDAVDDALEQWICVSDGPKKRGELLADLVR